AADADQRLMRERALGAEVAGAHPAGLRRAGGAAVALEREPNGLVLLGRELELGLSLVKLLGVEPRLIAVMDRRQHQPRALGVEQCDRRRLTARHLAVGV